MRLKKLQIKGFKSFADETVVRFDDPIIGIVGPNGSGKSNIVDSIRWVLGEQKSKDLRLDKMTDVIFNGSKKRKQGSLAQVTLTFENTKNLIPIEFDEVAVTRMLFIDGSSEYRINDVKCRLKDIRDLFLDSGIGSHSYAIIELKMVDDILLNTDRARLRMFEQAAGIAKYKARKKETLNKLNSTVNDLNRIEDLLYELENALKDLKKQAARTKKYNELKQNYKNQSISIAYFEIKSSEEKLVQIKTKIQFELDKYEKASSEKNVLEAKLEKVKRENLEKEKSLSSIQEAYNQLIDDTRKKESEKEIINQKIQFNRQTIAQNDSRTRQIDNEDKNLEQGIITIRASLENAQKEYQQINDKNISITEQYNKIKKERDSVRDMMSAVQNELLNNQKEVFDLEKSLALLENEIEASKSNFKQYEIQLEQLKISSVDDRNEKASLTEKVNFLGSELADLEKKILFETESKEKLNNDKALLEKEIQDINRLLDAKENEAKLLSEMIDNMEGFPSSAKFISNYWNKKIPLLQDVFDVASEYKSAIEQYIEPYLNYFISDDYASAEKSIGLLRDGQKGKTQFFILDAFTEQQNTIDTPPDCIPASTVIETNDKYKKLIQYLFKNVFISNNVTAISSLKLHENAVVIAGNGTIVKTKLSLRGGSIGIFEGKKIGRTKNLEKLKDLIKDLTEKKSKFEGQLQDIEVRIQSHSDKNYVDQKKKLELELNQFRIALAQKQTALASFETQISDLSQRLEHNLKTKESKEAKRSETEQNLIQLKTTLEAKKNSEQDSNELFSNINKVYDESSKLYNEHQIKLIKAQAKLDAFNAELNIKIEQKENQHKRKNDFQNETNRLSKESEDLNHTLQAINEELESFYKRKEEQKRSLSEQEQSFFAEKSSIIEEEDQLKKLEKVLIESQILINETKSQLQNINFSNHSIKERLQIEFGLDFNQIDAEELLDLEGENLVEIRVKVDRLRSRLENFGDINPLALNAYEEMLKRYENTIEQKNDILDAKQTLLDTISEIDSKATAKFHEAFVLIRDNFKEVFRSLFTDDDDCDLVLLNPDNPLESEIEIIAKPKGKRPKVLKQLSGGEKTLTATALLFSLYLLKPAPFCIFDEVDAPLDDINVSKFTKLIKKFSKDSQFIIITHNKGTMSTVDVLYGIFLKEEGVSGIAPVDFRQLDYV